MREEVSRLTECLEDMAGTVNPVSPADRTRVNDATIHLFNGSPTKRPLLFIIAGLSMLRRFSPRTLELINEVRTDSVELLKTIIAATMIRALPPSPLLLSTCGLGYHAGAGGGRTVRIADLDMKSNRLVKSLLRRECSQFCSLVQLQEVEASLKCA